MNVILSVSLILFPSIITVACSEDSCAVFTLHPNLSGNSGIHKRKVDNEERCKRTCLANTRCVAISWAPDYQFRCTIHYASQAAKGTSPGSGSSYWTLRRVGICPDEFRSRKRDVLGWLGGVVKQGEAEARKIATQAGKAATQAYRFVQTQGRKLLSKAGKLAKKAATQAYRFVQTEGRKLVTQAVQLAGQVATQAANLAAGEGNNAEQPEATTPMVEAEETTTEAEPETETVPQGPAKKTLPRPKAKAKSGQTPEDFTTAKVEMTTSASAKGGSSKGLLLKIGGGVGGAVLLIGILLCCMANKEEQPAVAPAVDPAAVPAVPPAEAPAVGTEGVAVTDLEGNQNYRTETPGMGTEGEGSRHLEERHEENLNRNAPKKEGGSNITIKEKKKASSSIDRMSQDGTALRTKGEKDINSAKESILSKIKGKAKKLKEKIGGQGDKAISPEKKSVEKPEVGKKKNIFPNNASMINKNTNYPGKALKISESSNNNPSTSFVISDKNDNNQSTASIVSIRVENRPDTASIINEVMNKRTELTPLMTGMKKTLAKRSEENARWNIIRHSITSSKTLPNIRYTETTEITPLMSVKSKIR